MNLRTRPASLAIARQSGFSLVEVLVAAALLSVGVVAMMGFLPQSHLMAKDAGRVSVLEHLAQQRLEQLQGLAYTHANLAVGTHPTAVLCGTGAYCYPVAGYSSDHSLRWIVTAGSPEANMKSIVLEATFGAKYTSGGVRIANPRALTVALRTYVSE